nr:hypothetical protein [Citrobacter freundii]
MHQSCTKNAVHPGHFGTIGKIVHKIFLVFVFIFIDRNTKP